VLHDLLLELADVLLEPVEHRAELRVLALETLDLVLEAGDALEFAAAALGGGDAVALTLALQLDALLALHVDGRHGRRVARVGLLLDAHAPRRHARRVVAAHGRRSPARGAAPAAAGRNQTAQSVTQKENVC